MRWLCLSDIHGDSSALAAVLATAERRGYSRILAAGDLCFPGDAPLETWRRLTSANATCVQGVSDRAIATLDAEALVAKDAHDLARLERLRGAQRELGDLILTKLAKLPRLLRIPLATRTATGDGTRELVLVHGSPADPTEPFTFDMTDADMLSLLGDEPGDIVICGGSHRFRSIRTVAGVRIPSTSVPSANPVGERLGESPRRCDLPRFFGSRPRGRAVRRPSPERRLMP